MDRFDLNLVLVLLTLTLIQGHMIWMELSLSLPPVGSNELHFHLISSIYCSRE